VRVIVGGPGDDLIISGATRTSSAAARARPHLLRTAATRSTATRDDFLTRARLGQVYAHAGNDTAIGGGGGEDPWRPRRRPADRRDQDDKLYSDAGNDVLIGGQGTDKMRGGSGDDWLRAAPTRTVLRRRRRHGQLGTATPGRYPPRWWAVTAGGTARATIPGADLRHRERDRLIFRDQLTGRGLGSRPRRRRRL
jgi:Ca2+-binding RTX toxin-like protein